LVLVVRNNLWKKPAIMILMTFRCHYVYLLLLFLLFHPLVLLTEAALHSSLLQLLTDDQLEKADRSTLVKTYAAPTEPTKDYYYSSVDDPSNSCRSKTQQQAEEEQAEEEEEETTCRADTTKVYRRSVFPRSSHNNNDNDTTTPLVCLAFLSCCGRTDLLQSTMNAVIRHMEQDEPEALRKRYEIVWVDNGSPQERQQHIATTFQIDSALPMPRNMGLVRFAMFAVCGYMDSFCGTHAFLSPPFLFSPCMYV
jgi:hypothetical protein